MGMKYVANDNSILILTYFNYSTIQKFGVSKHTKAAFI